MDAEKKLKRSPIIVVMGHVDHGKTSLLDYIRKTNIAEKEAGKITQSIGAYEILHKNERMTFIDTPGHEAFSKMRTRGAKVADIAILVVAADDSVQPQTKEAIKIAQDAKIPFVVAINKIDKNNADVDKTKNDLMQAGVLLEGYGGSVSWQGISAKTGEGVNELLDLIVLATEVEDLSYDPTAPAEGFVLEARLENKRGIITLAIVKNGTLRAGEIIATETASGKVKILETFLGERTKEILPSSPAVIMGFESLPKAGEEFFTKEAARNLQTKREALPISNQKVKREKTEKSFLRLILKADAGGSLEALSQIMKSLPMPENYLLEIVNESVGEITDGDVKSAVATGAIIIGFNVKPNKAAENLAKAQKVQIIQSNVVYDLLKAVEEFLKKLGRGYVKGDLEILAVFGKKGDQQIIGGKVIKGEIANQSTVIVVRKDSEMGTVKILNTQTNKKDVTKITENNEGGLMVSSEVEIKEGDHLIAN